ncbi:3-phosphoshikimate 1-carboxyvinyltransferase [Pseudoclavibacter sp. RFBB5]|uniref:3-phosphoshikimate 1-carboxyvinyltransferase n=1 Tax=Pseudoclavibacter sp. RFBB5 TaxID=2080574 RepID=UPI000CE81145|nr:3-phosphoshikimate 1-carboxyvinyltransferase [Pseudoclavibacter sp. RFBB5]PPG29616.1 3-phosphoshikimate 1-carboxyvinyltransferase [Pseudoclavibacter sp. RFBB5]
MEIFGYSGPRFDLYRDDEGSEPLTLGDGPWEAPTASAPIDARLQIPGSKSLTNRELVLSALAGAPSLLRHPLWARDTELMIEALRQLGTRIVEVPGDGRFGNDLEITPGELEGGVSIDCGLAGTVMRFVPPLASLALGPVAFDGDEAARRRPMKGTVDALKALGVEVRDDGRGGLPFSLYGTGEVTGGEVTIDAGASSQFVSGLLMAGARFEDGLTLIHSGDRVPSQPHIDMTLAALRERGVEIDDSEAGTWRVSPGSIDGRELTIEPDLSNAEPFLIAAIVAGGSVSIEDWPATTTQVGSHLEHLLPLFGAQISVADGVLTCTVERGIAEGAELPGVDLDLSEAGELAPNLAALCGLCTTTSRITGIAHLRGHETDRVAAIAAELRGIGCEVTELDDGLEIVPGPRTAHEWRSYEDHRMATSGAIVGLAIEGVTVDDIHATSKTLPQFTQLWQDMLDQGTVGDPDEGEDDGSVDLTAFSI